MRAILLACTLLAAVAVIVPPYLSAYLKQQSQTEPMALRAKKAPDRPGRLSGSVDRAEFKAAANGHFFLQAEVNFSPVSLMVDTGASTVALRVSDAERAGIRIFPADFVLPVSTANGQTLAAPVQLDSVAVAGIEIERVSAVVVPDRQLGVSLLGTSFLSRLRRFEIAGDTLIFEN